MSQFVDRRVTRPLVPAVATVLAVVSVAIVSPVFAQEAAPFAEVDRAM